MICTGEYGTHRTIAYFKTEGKKKVAISYMDYTSPDVRFSYDLRNNLFFKKDDRNYINALSIQQLNTLGNDVHSSSHYNQLHHNPAYDYSTYYNYSQPYPHQGYYPHQPPSNGYGSGYPFHYGY